MMMMLNGLYPAYIVNEKAPTLLYGIKQPAHRIYFRKQTQKFSFIKFWMKCYAL